jgi:hypothetical protein
MKFLSSLALSATLIFSTLHAPKAEAGLIITGVGAWGTAVSIQEKDAGYIVFGSLLTSGGLVLTIMSAINLGSGALPIIGLILDEQTDSEDLNNLVRSEFPFIDDEATVSELASVVAEVTSSVEVKDGEEVYVTVAEKNVSELLERLDLTQEEKEEIVLKLTK